MTPPQLPAGAPVETRRRRYAPFGSDRRPISVRLPADGIWRRARTESLAIRYSVSSALLWPSLPESSIRFGQTPDQCPPCGGRDFEKSFSCSLNPSLEGGAGEGVQLMRISMPLFLISHTSGSMSVNWFELYGTGSMRLSTSLVIFITLILSL